MSAYSLSVALRALMAPGSHPGAFQAKSICRICGGVPYSRGEEMIRFRDQVRWDGKTGRERG